MKPADTRRPWTDQIPALRHTIICRLAKWLLLAVLTGLVACTNHAVPSGSAPSVSFQTLKSAEPIALHSIGKPLLVNFWSTSCGICLKEMPELARAYREMAPRGFEMVAVAMPQDRPSDVLEMAEAGDWPFPVAIDLDASVSNAFGSIKGTPTSFLIAADGSYIRKTVGAVDIDALKKEVNKLLGASS